MTAAFPCPLAFHALNPEQLPEYAQAPIDFTDADLQPLSAQGFADPVRRTFPLHSKAATFMSAVALYGQDVPADTMAETRLLKAASAHGVLEDVREVQTFFQTRKEAAAEPVEPLPDFALVLDFGNGDLRGFLPLNSEASVQDASRNLFKIAAEERVSYPQAHEAASRICKVASEMGVDQRTLHPDIMRLAGLMDVNFEKAAMFIEARHHVVPAADMPLYRDLVKRACSSVTERAECLELLAELDDINGVRYGGAQLDPYRAVFSGDWTKQAFEQFADSMVFINDIMVPGVVLTRIADGTLEAQFSLETAGVLKEACARAGTDAAGASELIQPLDWEEQKTLLSLALDHSE